MFENVSELEFDRGLNIHAILSSEKERMPLVEPVNTGTPVEKWLQRVEYAMQAAVSRQCELAHAAFTSKPRTEWAIEWPGAVAIVVTQIMWTANTEMALLSDEPNTFQTYARNYSVEVEQFCSLSRTKLPKLQRIQFIAMLTLDVHSRDVLSEMLDSGVDSLSNFTWCAQLRDYFDAVTAAIEVRMVTCGVLYGNEYLGNTNRLVVTPLTDRCYRSLMLADKLHLVGAPQGPAGTGKTETTKDLAKALARQCVVFNCSYGLDYKAMAKFFKGIAASGAWACELARTQPVPLGSTDLYNSPALTEPLALPWMD